MAENYTFTVDAVGNPESIIAQSVCRSIKLRQADQSDAALLKFKIRRSSITGPTAQYQGGDTSDLLTPGEGRFWKTGDTAGYIETNSSSATFLQIED